MFSDQTYPIRTATKALALLLTLAAVLGGCVQKLDPVSPDDGNGWNELDGDQPLRFVSSQNQMPSTKAGSLLPAGGTFGVMAYLQEGNLNTHVAAKWSDGGWYPSFMYNQKVTFDGTDTYEYSPIKYWPNNAENTISFWAYSPYNANTVFYQQGTTTLFDNASTGLPDIQFSVTSGKDDFMTADFVPDKTYANCVNESSEKGRVRFDFHHHLTRIYFKARTAGDYSGLSQTLKIQQIEIINHYNTGVLSQNIAATPNSTSWSRLSGEAASVTAFAGEKTLSYTAENCGDAVFMIPQNIRHTGSGESGNKVSVRVHYTLTINNVTIPHSSVVSMDYNDEVLVWEENKSYEYTVLLSATDGLSIKVQVQPWEYWLGTGDYEENVTVTQQLSWDNQTYDTILNNQPFTIGTQTKNFDVVVLKANTDLVGYFTFDTPYHGTWVAMLEPIAGSDFESIVFNNNQIQKDGVVGGNLSISIKAGSGDYSHNQYALLRFMCRTEDGQTLAVQDGAIGGPYVIALYVN